MLLKTLKNVIKIFIFLSLIIFNKWLFLYPIYIHPFYLKHKKSILSIDNSKKEILKKGRKFLDKCLNNINDNTYKYIEYPRASVIIPLYNCEDTIESSIRSIQYQNMTKIDIILVNDFSIDNTLEIIKNIEKKDKRIKIINNKKNKGTLYSRSVGVLMSKGKYIFNLDNDDMYFDFDIFDYLYQKCKKEKLDIAGFLTVNIYNYTANIKKMKDIYTYLYNEDLFLTQPELSIWMITFKDKFLVHNNMIWDKCINSQIYKKAINIIGTTKISQFIVWAEDTSILFIIFRLANSFKYIYKYGIAHYKGNTTASKNISIDSKIYGDVFFLDLSFDFSKNNTKEKNLVIGQALYIYKRYNFNTFTNDIKSNYFRIVLNKIIKCKYLKKKNARKIKKIFSDFFIYNSKD